MKEEMVDNFVHDIGTSLGITQEDLAKKVGVSRQTIIAIEKGNYIPSVLLALKIAQFFKKSVEQVFHITQ